MSYYIGLDLGCRLDNSVASVLEATQSPGQRKQYVLRDLKRWKLATPYSEIAASLVRLLKGPPLDTAVLACDVTGVGEPVFQSILESLKASGSFLRGGLLAITIHGGMNDTGEGCRLSVSKRSLVSVTQSVLTQGRLKIPRKLDEAGTLVSELQSFSVRITDTGAATFAASGGQHDDTVLSLACGLFAGEQFNYQPPPPPLPPGQRQRSVTAWDF